MTLRVRYFPHPRMFDVDGIIALPLDVDWMHVNGVRFTLHVRRFARMLHLVP